MGQPPSEQGGGESNVHVRKVLGARAEQCPGLLSPATHCKYVEIIRAVHLRQQN